MDARDDTWFIDWYPLDLCGMMIIYRNDLIDMGATGLDGDTETIGACRALGDS